MKTPSWEDIMRYQKELARKRRALLNRRGRDEFKKKGKKRGWSVVSP